MPTLIDLVQFTASLIGPPILSGSLVRIFLLLVHSPHHGWLALAASCGICTQGSSQARRTGHETFKTPLLVAVARRLLLQLVYR